MTKLKNSDINKKAYNLLHKLNYQRHLYSIRISFISMMPLMIIGVYAVVLNNLPIPIYQDTMMRLFGSNWRNFGALIYNSTLQIATLILIFSICTNLSKWYEGNMKIAINPIMYLQSNWIQLIFIKKL